MNISRLDLFCLNALCDDIENVSSIKVEINNLMNKKVSDKDIGNCLLNLVKGGLADAYIFCSSKWGYMRVNTDLFNWSDKWFSITPKGRAELDANWTEK